MDNMDPFMRLFLSLPEDARSMLIGALDDEEREDVLDGVTKIDLLNKSICAYLGMLKVMLKDFNEKDTSLRNAPCNARLFNMIMTIGGMQLSRIYSLIGELQDEE